MKKKLLFPLVLLIVSIANAQINFESGYFINNNDKKTTCFIKNVDWKNNPNGITYKLTLEGNSETAKISDIKEFGVDNSSKFIRATVAVDVSKSETDQLEHDRRPKWVNQTIFLKVVIEGEANLYYYEGGNLKRFFYSTETISIEQLIYKLYIDDVGSILENVGFKQQLLNNVKCDKISMSTIEKLDYSLNNLQDYFAIYNGCYGEIAENYSQKKSGAKFNLNIRPGLSYSTLTVETPIAFQVREIDPGFGFRIGVEAEMVLPFNKNKWSVFVEVAYQHFKSQDSYGETKYSSIEIPVGIRHYFFINDDSKIFINVAFIPDIPFSSSYIAPDININRNSTFAYGVGFNYKKYSFEARYSNKNIIITDRFSASEHKTFSFILGYSIFKKKSIKK